MFVRVIFILVGLNKSNSNSLQVKKTAVDKPDLILKNSYKNAFISSKSLNSYYVCDFISISISA